MAAMPYRALADFLEELGQAGELARVEAQVDPLLEVAELSARVAQAEGPALLFANLKGHDLPLLTNLLATEGRICRALGVGSLKEATERIERLTASGGPEGWLDRLRPGSRAGGLASFLPRTVKSAACQQIVRLGSDVDLGMLPLVQSAPHEASRAITAAAVYFAEPDSHRQVVGRYDLQLLAGNRLAVGWAAHEEPARLLVEYGRRNERMPLAAVLGGDPACLLAAAALTPPGADGLALAGLLREKPLDAVACRSVDLMAPADAEIVIEGYVDASEAAVEAGPLAAPAGHYTLPRPMPVMHVTAVTHRANPIFPAMVPGLARGEAAIVDRALARMFLPLVKAAIPELIDYDLPLCGVARHAAVLAIRKTCAGQTRRVASIAWGLRQFAAAKLLVLVDEAVVVHDLQQVFRAIALQANPGQDVFFQQGPPDPLDPTTLPCALGQKMAIDATWKLPEERGGHPLTAALMDERIHQLVSSRWSEYGLGPAPSGH
jgi:4-hydroxy-3-polyprenylbenzoate decarboxylase